MISCCFDLYSLLLSCFYFLQLFANPINFPVTITFGIPRLSPNDRITLASMFQAIHHMSRVLTPISANTSDSAKESSSGIQSLETPECRLHCYESIAGTKFILITDSKLPAAARDSLKLIYETYTDYVLKNPFYLPNQPFNFEFFNSRLKKICEQAERGIYV